MKINKKIIFILVITIINTFLSANLQIHAGEIGNDDQYIEYSHDADMTDTKAEKIARSILGLPDNTPSSRGNILCLFGHDIKTGTVLSTEHNYYSTTPKCRETRSSVEYCGRGGCDYYVVTNQITSRIACH